MKISNNDKILYENTKHWDNVDISDHIQNKINKIKDIIPADVNSLIDVGCGNGIILNQLVSKWNGIGIDRSWVALKHVNAHKVNADIQNLPIQSDKVDLVICSEVLEHLPESVLKKAIAELKRISKKYILITVPNNEYLQKNYVKCSACKYKFNASYHLNSFDLDSLFLLFSNFNLVYEFKCGKMVRQYNPVLLKIKQRLGNSWARFSSVRHFICPGCHHDFEYKQRVNIISILCDGVNRLITKKKPYWLGILVSKK